MIKRKTMLIIGAGASAPYGYPVGASLKQQLQDPSNLIDLETKFHKDEINKFCQMFKLAGRYSIDSFLSHQMNYAEIGKSAIANQLIKHETLENLTKPIEDHWLEYVWNQMTANDLPKTEFTDNQLKIISFNYDRVVEQYLQTVIKNYYGVDIEEAINLQKTIEIVHVYGMLQDLDKRPYGNKPSDLSEVANCIKVIPEDRKTEDKEFEKAKEMIDWAEKICFIGFGFDKTNLHRLGFPNHLPMSKMWGNRIDGTKYGFTQYGMTKHEIDAARKLLNGGRILPANAIRRTIDIDNAQKISKLKTLDYFKYTGFFLEEL